MDAHHHPVRQTMVTGTNLEKQLPIFPCSDPKNTSMGLYIYIYRWYSTFIYYLLCMTLNFKYSRPNPMDDQESHLPKSTAWNSSPAMMHCIALHPCLLHSTTTSTHEIHHQFGQHQANSVEQTHIVCGKGVLLATTLLALISVFPWNLCHRRSLENTTSYKHYLKNMWLNLIMIHFHLDFPLTGRWHSWQIPLLFSCLPIGSSVTWHHIIGCNWTWNMHAVSDAERNLLRKTSQGEEEEEEEEVNVFGLNWGQRKMPILSNQLQYSDSSHICPNQKN